MCCWQTNKKHKNVVRVKQNCKVFPNLFHILLIPFTLWFSLWSVSVHRTYSYITYLCSKQSILKHKFGAWCTSVKFWVWVLFVCMRIICSECICACLYLCSRTFIVCVCLTVAVKTEKVYYCYCFESTMNNNKYCFIFVVLCS